MAVAISVQEPMDPLPKNKHHRRFLAKPAPAAAPSPEAIRVVGGDGRVRVYRRPVSAGELMKEAPLHLVCRSDAFLIGHKIPALPPSERLQPGSSYFLLPSHLFHSVLSFVSLASSLLSLLAAGSAGKIRPFEISKTPSGTLQITVCDDFLISSDDEGDDGEAGSKLCSNERLEKEYQELVGYSKSKKWVPRLDTIVEISGDCSDGEREAESPARLRRRAGAGFLGLRRLGSRRRRE